LNAQFSSSPFRNSAGSKPDSPADIADTDIADTDIANTDIADTDIADKRSANFSHCVLKSNSDRDPTLTSFAGVCLRIPGYQKTSSNHICIYIHSKNWGVFSDQHATSKLRSRN
jgi:hypothetical protein